MGRRNGHIFRTGSRSANFTLYDQHTFIHRQRPDLTLQGLTLPYPCYSIRYSPIFACCAVSTREEVEVLYSQSRRRALWSPSSRRVKIRMPLRSWMLSSPWLATNSLLLIPGGARRRNSTEDNCGGGPMQIRRRDVLLFSRLKYAELTSVFLILVSGRLASFVARCAESY